MEAGNVAEFKPFNLADIYMKAESVKGARQNQQLRGKQMQAMDAEIARNDIMALGQFSQDLLASPDPAALYNQSLPDLRNVIRTPQILDKLQPMDDPQRILAQAKQAAQFAQSLAPPQEVKQFMEVQGEDGTEIVGFTGQGTPVPTGQRPAAGGKKPAMRERYEGNTLVQEQLNPATNQWEEIGRGPRFSGGSPSVEDEIIPIVQKIRDGKEVTPQEREALEIWQRSNPIDRLISVMIRNTEGTQGNTKGGGSGQGSALTQKAINALQEAGEGVPVTFANGETWRLQNGQPVRAN